MLFRALDLAELLAPSALLEQGWNPGDSMSKGLERRLLDLHRCVTNALEAFRKEPKERAREVILDYHHENRDPSDKH
ncbi:hypothetical protein [Deinococcus hopiensis]|uniref:Uncharacterized protein n=1 Tax=Deinococcus hopiensis KR-140 TaxID=695939 RepID=A0A1W1UDF7_9DEIO|nr:hypothetical protein [Deinococcus hopiensis]SMB79136.1 hypothetical protein SAMN00790413_05784 [Deinococcus hopiensis KR-140]